MSCNHWYALEDVSLIAWLISADLYGSLDDDVPTILDGPRSHLLEPPPNSTFYSQGFRAIHQASDLDIQLCRCISQLEDIMLFMPNPGDGNVKTTALAKANQMRLRLASVQYTLLSDDLRQSLDISIHAKMFECIRITLILYSLSIVDERPADVTYGHTIGSKLRRILCDMAQQPYSEVLRPTVANGMTLSVDFQLWAIFLAVSVMRGPRSDTKDWLLESLSNIVSAEVSCMHTWHDLLSRMSRYLWVPSIHDHTCQQLWTEATEMSRKIEEMDSSF
jgi:hypothetical protein